VGCHARQRAQGNFGFNPTLVRFCHDQQLDVPCLTGDSAVSIPPWFDFAGARDYLLQLAENKFQSHLGSILPVAKRFCQARPEIDALAFQSHLGSILPRQIVERQIRAARVAFQSHLGSILPLHAIAASTCTGHLGFNPTLVRFCHGVAQAAHPRSMGTVSIPPWFDFAKSHQMSAEIRIPRPVVSIPPWFDFARELCSGQRLTQLARFQSHLGSILP
jgi:hypothetical protein